MPKYIILCDKYHTIRIPFEPQLSERSPFFKNLLSFKEGHEEKVYVNVDKAIIAQRVIQNHPKTKDGQTLIEEIICRDYFGMDIDFDSFEDVDISDNVFPNLLALIDIFGYRGGLIKAIYHHSLDLKIYPKELEEIIQCIAIYREREIEFREVFDLSIITKFYRPEDSCCDVPMNHLKSMVCAGKYNAWIYDMKSGKKIKSIKTTIYDPVIEVSPDNDIVFVYDRGDYSLWYLDDNTITDSIQIGEYIIGVAFSGKNIYVAALDYIDDEDHKVRIINITTNRCIKNYRGWIKYFKMIIKGDTLAISFELRDDFLSNYVAEIIHLKEENNINLMINYRPRSFCFSDDGLSLVIGRERISIFDVKTGEKIHEDDRTCHVLRYSQNKIIYNSSDHKSVGIAYIDSTIPEKKIDFEEAIYIFSV